MVLGVKPNPAFSLRIPGKKVDYLRRTRRGKQVTVGKGGGTRKKNKLCMWSRLGELFRGAPMSGRKRPMRMKNRQAIGTLAEQTNEACGEKCAEWGAPFKNALGGRFCRGTNFKKKKAPYPAR